MTRQTIQLDNHRGAADQKATELRRLLLGVEAEQSALKLRVEELEVELAATASLSWVEAGEKARYLISLLLTTTAARDPRRKKLIASVLHDIERLSDTKL